MGNRWEDARAWDWRATGLGRVGVPFCFFLLFVFFCRDTGEWVA